MYLLLKTNWPRVNNPRRDLSIMYPGNNLFTLKLRNIFLKLHNIDGLRHVCRAFLLRWDNYYPFVLNRGTLVWSEGWPVDFLVSSSDFDMEVCEEDFLESMIDWSIRCSVGHGDLRGDRSTDSSTNDGSKLSRLDERGSERTELSTNSARSGQPDGQRKWAEINGQLDEQRKRALSTNCLVNEGNKQPLSTNPTDDSPKHSKGQGVFDAWCQHNRVKLVVIE